MSATKELRFKFCIINRVLFRIVDTFREFKNKFLKYLQILSEFVEKFINIY